jgi:hypothetical protein
MLRGVLFAVTCVLGITSRRLRRFLPAFIGAYAGDTLWALAASLGIGFLLPRTSIGLIAVVAMSFATLIEVSQLYHAPWIDAIRHTTLGGLILGYEFIWTDLVCYAVGVGLGAIIESTCMARRGWI